MQTANGLRLLEAAKQWVGKNAHQDNLAPSDVACADSVETVYRVLFGTNIDNKPDVVSTTTLYHILQNTPTFTEVITPEAGDIIIAPTGLQATPHGHVGIYGDNGLIYSNNSYTGLWDHHLNTTSWAELFTKTFYFRCTDVVDLPTA